MWTLICTVPLCPLINEEQPVRGEFVACAACGAIQARP
jgi:hypothetical protein